MGGNTEIRNESQKASAIRFQSSMFGGVVPLLHGTNAVPPNLLDYGDFRSYQHQSTETQGGKGGGGVDTTSVWYTYTANVVFGLVEGPILGLGKIWKGKVSSTDVTMLLGEQGGSVWTYQGDIGQGSLSFLSTMAGGAHNIGYSGLALVGVLDYDLGDTAQVENHRFEVRGRGSNLLEGIPDCPPQNVLYDWVTSSSRGLGRPHVIDILGTDSMADFDAYTRAAGIWISPLLQEQAPATDRFLTLQRICDAALIEVDGKIKVVPLGAADLSRQIGSSTVTWSARTQPQYALDPDVLLPRGNDQALVEIQRKPSADAFNVVEIEFRDRGADYAPSVARKVDQAGIDTVGEKPAPKLTYDWICDPAVADRVAQLELNRHVQQRATYRFDLPWNFALLMPTAIVTLTVPGQGLESLPVRITRREETEGGFSFEAIDFPVAISAQPLHTLPVVDGFRNDYAAAPGNTTVHAVFEAPKAMADGLELWIACDGASSAWGGCHVWISADGVEYRQVATFAGRSRTGTFELAATTSATLFRLEGVSGQLGSGSALDASLNATLCWAAGEFFSYETATLTAAGKYSLTGLIRGVHGSRRSAKATGSKFVRCDGAVAKTGPIGLQMVGRQIWIKSQSFNIFGLATQAIADVTAVTYTPTGDLALAPEVPAGNLVPEGEFSLLALGRKPDTWSGGVVSAVSGHSEFTAALDCSAVETNGLNRIAAVVGERFWFSSMLDTSGSSTSGSAGLAFYDVNGSRLSFVPASAASPAGTAWRASAGLIEAPSSSAWCVPSVVRGGAGSGVCSVADVSCVRQLITQDVSDQAMTEVADITSVGVGIFSPGVDYFSSWAVLKFVKGGRILLRGFYQYVSRNDTGSAVNNNTLVGIDVRFRKFNDIDSESASATESWSGSRYLSIDQSMAPWSVSTRDVSHSWSAQANEDGYVFFRFSISKNLYQIFEGAIMNPSGASKAALNIGIVMESINK